MIPYRNLLDDVKVWDLKKEERVQLVYVLQSNFYKKACFEFHEASRLYTEVKDESFFVELGGGRVLTDFGCVTRKPT